MSGINPLFEGVVDIAVFGADEHPRKPGLDFGEGEIREGPFRVVSDHEFVMNRLKHVVVWTGACQDQKFEDLILEGEDEPRGGKLLRKVLKTPSKGSDGLALFMAGKRPFLIPQP